MAIFVMLYLSIVFGYIWKLYQFWNWNAGIASFVVVGFDYFLWLCIMMIDDRSINRGYRRHSLEQLLLDYPFCISTCFVVDVR